MVNRYKLTYVMPI